MTDQPTIIPVEYRTWHNGIPPRRTKLDIGGWAGENTWKSPQPWHCKPYSDASTYALELIYPWETTCEVTCDAAGKCKFKGDFSKEKPSDNDKDWEPFGAFAPFHFGYLSMIDIKTPPGHGLMVQPHPRVYSDRDGSTPVAVPGILEMDWWPEVFFIVFKAPLPGCRYVFKKGDPIASFMIVPKNVRYDINEMSEQDRKTRAERQRKLETNWNRMCTRVFYCEDEEEFFDNKYKVLSNIAKRDGNEQAQAYMDDPKSLPHWHKNPTVVDHRPEGKRVPKHNPWTEKKKPSVRPIKKEEEVVKEEVKNDEPKTVVKDAIKNYLPPVLPENFWEGVPPPEEDRDIEEYGLGELEEVLSKTEDFSVLSDDQMHDIITAFKRQKRKVRMERTMKVKSQCQPSKLVQPAIPGANRAIGRQHVPQPQQQTSPNKEGWVLGHKMEKLI